MSAEEEAKIPAKSFASDRTALAMRVTIETVLISFTYSFVVTDIELFLIIL
jgi:hypothetical protein